MTWLLYFSRVLSGTFALIGAFTCAVAWAALGVPRTDIDWAYCIALHAITLFAAGLWAVAKSEAA